MRPTDMHSADFTIGEWTVLPSLNVLARGGEQVKLEPRVMSVLVALAERAGRPVSKEQLAESVWKCQYITDDVLTVTISALRKALGDNARQPRYVETVSRRGYRLIAPVRPPSQSPADAPAGAPADVPADVPDGARATPQPPRRAPWTVAAAAAVVLAAGTLMMLATAQHTRHAPSPEAYEAYVKGRYFLDQRSVRGWQRALEQFERAVALDPRDPAAHAGLADAYAAMSDFGIASPAEMRPRAMRAAQRAIELDPRSAEAQEALGRAQFIFDWDFAAAERSLKRALALNPDYMPAYQTMAWLKSARGQHGEAVAAARRALQLDPVNTARYTELAWVLSLRGRYGEALREVDRALQLDPQSFEAYLTKAGMSVLAGQPDTAFAAYRNALRLGGASDEALQRADAVYRAEGMTGFYRRLLERRGGSSPMSNTWRAQIYVRVGDLDHAIESLQSAYRQRESALAWVNVDPSFAPLRSDPRFQDIAARVARAN